MAVTPEMSLQMRTAVKGQQVTGKNNDLLQSVSVAEDVEEIVKMEQTSDRPDEKDEFPENPQTDSLHKVDSEEWAPRGLGPQAEILGCKDGSTNEGTWSRPRQLVGEDQQHYTKDKQHREYSEENLDSWRRPPMWRLLTEVISLENQSESLEDPDEEANIEEKITEIRKQLKEMNIKLAQVDACNEARELKEKLIERIESFYKEMNVLNAKLEIYNTQERETDSHSSEDLDTEQIESPLPEASPTPPGSHSPLYSAVWKHALKLFFMFYVVTITGLSCYILFVDATFLFERVLPSVLGHRTMWELREMVAPFLNLEAEDLLPS